MKCDVCGAPGVHPGRELAHARKLQKQMVVLYNE